jgi:hypothetical protein
MTTTELEDPAGTGDDLFGDPADPDAPDGDKPYKAIIVRGRYKLPDPDSGEKRMFSRTSTIAKTLADTYHLDRWNDRMIVAGLAARPDLVTLAGAVDLEDKETLQDIAEQAKTAAGARQGANHGTALHALAERADRGEELPKGTHRANVKGIQMYRDALEAAGATVVPGWMERVVLCSGLDIVGRLDRVLQINPAALGMSIPGPVFAIGDLKTQKTMDFGALDIAIQLSIYANADLTYNEDTGEWEEIQMDIQRNWGLVMHLPSTGGKCDIYLINLAKGWAYTQMAMAVRKARKDKSLLKPVVHVDENPWTRAIMSAQSKTELSAIWRDAHGRGEWNSKLEALGKQRQALLESGAQRAIGNGKDE